MILLRSRRSVRVIAWLLTPIVVWAASFLGGWAGLVAGNRVDQARALWWGLAGGVLGGTLAVVIWVARLRVGARREAARRRSAAPNDHSADT